MSYLPQIVPQPYSSACISVIILAIYYAVVSALLHWRPKARSVVTQYTPPDAVTPAVAACLLQDGRFERAFAAALVSLASKGCIQIHQQNDLRILQKLRDPDSQLPPAENEILKRLFSESDMYAFNATDCDLLCASYRDFEKVMEGIIDPDLISSHLFFWIAGIVASVGICVQFLMAQPEFTGKLSLWPIGYIGLWTVLGASCLVAAIRVWPDTFDKLVSWFVRRGGRRRPITLNDSVPVFLTVTAAAGFALLGATTSAPFAVLTATLVLVIAFAREALEAPTPRGRDVIQRLRGFREFLLRADADRLTRENSAGATPQLLEQYSGYAVAFGIDLGFGQDFAAGLSDLLEFNRGFQPWPENIGLKISRNTGPIELNLRNKG